MTSEKRGYGKARWDNWVDDTLMKMLDEEYLVKVHWLVIIVFILLVLVLLVTLLVFFVFLSIIIPFCG